MYCTGDPSASYIGHKTGAMDGTSPRNLKVETLGDVLRRVEPRSKVIGISGKDRGAILPAGQDRHRLHVHGEGPASSPPPPTTCSSTRGGWTAFNAAKPADRFFKAEWKPLLPKRRTRARCRTASPGSARAAASCR